jgi:hypothetical protein
VFSSSVSASVRRSPGAPEVVLLLGEERDVRVAEAAVARLPSDLGKYADGDQTLDGDEWLPRR